MPPLSTRTTAASFLGCSPRPRGVSSSRQAGDRIGLSLFTPHAHTSAAAHHTVRGSSSLEDALLDRRIKIGANVSRLLLPRRVRSTAQSLLRVALHRPLALLVCKGSSVTAPLHHPSSRRHTHNTVSALSCVEDRRRRPTGSAPCVEGDIAVHYNVTTLQCCYAPPSLSSNFPAGRGRSI